MIKILIDEATVKLVLEALEHCKDVIVERGLNGNPEFAERWGLTLPLDRSKEAITALKALAEQPAPPPECQTEAEKMAFAFGWWKALEAQPAQRKPLKLWTEAQHERAYRNSPELHKDVKSLAAFKRVAKEIAAMYGIKEKNT